KLQLGAEIPGCPASLAVSHLEMCFYTCGKGAMHMWVLCVCVCVCVCVHMCVCVCGHLFCVMCLGPEPPRPQTHGFNPDSHLGGSQGRVYIRIKTSFCFL